MAKQRILKTTIREVIEDPGMTTEEVQRYLRIGAAQVYMLSKTLQIETFDITITGNGGPQSKRYTYQSVKNFRDERIAAWKSEMEKNDSA